MALQCERARQAQQRLGVGTTWSNQFGDLVFTDEHGLPVHGPNLTKRLQRQLRDLELSQVGMHGLRRSAASLLAAQNVPARVAMEVLGHSQIATTMDLYTKVFPSAMNEAAAAMKRALKRS